MKLNASILAIAGLSALLSACGGDGTNTGAVPDPGTKTVAISAANQSDVARATVNGGMSLALVQGAADGPTATTSSTTAAEGVLRHVLHAAVSRRASIASAMAHPETGSSETDACGVSGTVTSTWNDADNNSQLSAGDVVTASFQQCHDTTAVSVNGALVLTLTGTPTASQFTANAVFQNMTVAYGGVTYSMNGALSLSETDTDTLTSTSFTVGSAGLTVLIVSTGYNDSIGFDSGMTVASSFLAGSSSTTQNGSFTAQSIGGRVTIATPVALVQQYTDTYPSSGQVRITGASGSTVLATVLNSAQVQLQLDANGDGTVDSTTTVAWATLVP